MDYFSIIYVYIYIWDNPSIDELIFFKIVETNQIATVKTMTLIQHQILGFPIFKHGTG